MIIEKNDAISHGREGVTAVYYQLPNTHDGITVARATFTGEHGERTIGHKPRIYLLLNGDAKFLINGEESIVKEGGLVVIEPKSTYNLWPVGESVEIILVSELLNL